MKKRLLLTSIVMMIVVAVVLSTATYAWFTSNASVTASTVTLTAESSGGTALGIGWLDGTTGTTITDFADVTWSGATTYTDGGVAKFNTPYASVSPYQYNGTVDANIKDTFYIENLSTANTISTIVLTLSDVADTNTLLRVGVFTSSTANGTYTLRGVLGADEDLDTEWGEITAKGQVVADLCDDEVATVTSIEFTNLSAQGKIFFKVVAWLDGVVLDDTTAESTSTLGLNFLAE